MLLSCLLRTYNEERWLPRILPLLLKLCDEIVVADGGSTDDTEAIAINYMAMGHNVTWVDASDTIICTDPHFNHAGKQLNIGLAECRGDWVYTQDVDIVPCERYDLHLRKTLKATDHDALLMYGVHLIGDEHHYAGELGIGPGIVQLFRNKEGVQFPDIPEHAHHVEYFAWENLGVFQGGQFHWGYMDREKEIEKIALRAKALPSDPTYKHLAENAPAHKPTEIPWDRCSPNCKRCWMEDIAREEMLKRTVKQRNEIIYGIQYQRYNLAAARTVGKREWIDMQSARYDQLLIDLATVSRRAAAMKDRMEELAA
jgi:glycosyltransferase involved in cell wall biosynthesis